MKKRKFHPKQFARFILSVLVVSMMIYCFIDFCRFPEKSCPTLKYQMENDIKRGVPEAEEYFNRVYKMKNIVL